jgi:Ca2+-binding EF-hand superfamily protein
MKKLMIIAAVILFSAAAQADDAKKMKYFNKWDADRSGSLNEAEFTEMVRVQFKNKGKEGYEDEAAHRFGRKDADGNGEVSFEEFKASPK